MKTYGVDYLDSSDDSIKYMVVDAESLDEARERLVRFYYLTRFPSEI